MKKIIAFINFQAFTTFNITVYIFLNSLYTLECFNDLYFVFTLLYLNDKCPVRD